MNRCRPRGICRRTNTASRSEISTIRSTILIFTSVAWPTKNLSAAVGICKGIPILRAVGILNSLAAGSDCCRLCRMSGGGACFIWAGANAARIKWNFACIAKLPPAGRRKPRLDSASQKSLLHPGSICGQMGRVKIVGIIPRAWVFHRLRTTY